MDRQDPYLKLRFAQIHLVQQTPEIKNPTSSHPDRLAVRILEACAVLVAVTEWSESVISALPKIERRLNDQNR